MQATETAIERIFELFKDVRFYKEIKLTRETTYDNKQTLYEFTIYVHDSKSKKSDKYRFKVNILVSLITGNILSEAIYNEKGKRLSMLSNDIVELHLVKNLGRKSRRPLLMSPLIDDSRRGGGGYGLL